MFRLNHLCLSSLLLATCLLSVPAPAQNQRTDNKAMPFQIGQHIDPNLTFQTIDGGTVRLADLDHPLIMIHYWASWCGLCLLEFPDMLDSLRGMNNDIAVIAISLDFKQTAMNNYTHKLNSSGVPIYWVFDPKMDWAYNRFKITGTPETIFLDSNYRVVKKFNDGYDWRSGQSWKELTALIANSI